MKKNNYADGGKVVIVPVSPRAAQSERERKMNMLGLGRMKKGGKVKKK